MIIIYITKLICLFLIAIKSKIANGQARFFCYEAVRDINTGANDCPPPLMYQQTVQLCCGTQPIAGATLQQTYDQIPQPGSADAIPDGCERGLRFPSGMIRCRSGLMLRTIGRNQLCCSPNVQLPPSQGGTPGGQQPGLIPRPQFTTGPGAALSACVDLAAPGRASDCPARRDLCNNDLYRDLMTQQCPQTCNRCGARAALGAQFANGNVAANGACVDRVGPNGRSDCPDRVAYCNVPIYRSLMMQECAFTCNFCNAAATNQQQRIGRPRILIPPPSAGGINPTAPGGGGGGGAVPPGIPIPIPPGAQTPLPQLPPTNNVSPPGNLG